ncbi:MAG TPA: sugar ABC transporter substrate-binding protein [Roseiflexaceae bacterium]|nr:sugar ABC transporter substrate-binding protein [Roseiflexaceae bacterium]
MLKRSPIRSLWSLLLALLLLAACSGGAPTGQQPTAGKAATPTAARQERVSLVLSDWLLTEKHWEPSLLKAVERYKQDHLNVDLHLDYVSYAEKDKKYAAEMAAGTGPDVVHLHAYALRSFIERGYLLDLTSFVEQEGGEAYLSTWYPQATDLTRKDQKTYGIPADYMTMALFYNAELFEEAGLDPDKPPKTWSEFEEYARKLTRDRDGDGAIDTWGFGTIGAVDPGFELRFSPFLYSHGADYLNAQQTCSALNTPEARAAFNFFTGLGMGDSVIPPGVTNQNAGSVRRQMASDQVAMKIGSGWSIPIMAAVNPTVKETVRVAPIPAADGVNAEYTTTGWVSVWAINRNTKHPKEAWELIKFLTAAQQEQQWFDDARVTSARQDVSTQYTPLLNDPVAQVLVGQRKTARFVPQLKEWPQIIEAINKATQDAFTGTATQEQALREAHNRINIILSVYQTDGQTCPAF